MFKAEQYRIITHLPQLSAPFQSLAKNIIKMRCRSAPWNFANHPANQSFIQKLNKRKINIEPWLNPPELLTKKVKGNKHISLVFEKDPLNIFQMGWHFKTCLSPGDCNFFSVFANAADINKHVIYAYDEDGKVIGRCLLALCEDGRILTFEPYCHDNSIKFGNIVGNVAEDLAAQMNTTIALRGNVPTLVAPEWYDDGPRDLCGRFTFLNHNSDFRKSLKTIEIDQFLPELEKRFSPIPLDALALNLILDLQEINIRPELILPLIPKIEKCKGLTDYIWLHAAHLAYRADNMKFPYTVLQTKAEPYLIRMYRQQRCYNHEWIYMVVELNPSMALRIMRRSRPHRVQTDEDEGCEHRLSIYIKAFQKLGRNERAQKLKEMKKM